MKSIRFTKMVYVRLGFLEFLFYLIGLYYFFFLQLNQRHLMLLNSPAIQLLADPTVFVGLLEMHQFAVAKRDIWVSHQNVDQNAFLTQNVTRLRLASILNVKILVKELAEEIQNAELLATIQFVVVLQDTLVIR